MMMIACCCRFAASASATCCTKFARSITSSASALANRQRHGIGLDSDHARAREKVPERRGTRSSARRTTGPHGPGLIRDRQDLDLI
jgi:hypothetical protein